MSDHEVTNEESQDEDSLVDALSAVALILIAAAGMIYWVAGQ